jgi:TPP-dependent trihydroxycyclohexane-1,2-dione (THcHDO) dehydratase
MSPNLAAPGTVRSAAVVNEDIRALVIASGGWLYGDARDRYEALVEEWAAAVRAEMVPAA